MISLVLSTLLAVAGPIADSTAVSSAAASYDGNALILKGQVILDHGLGKMKAEEAILERQEIGKEFPFSFIHLRKDVLLSLSHDATLSCDSADLDFVSLKGHITGDKRLCYTDSIKRKKGGRTLFCLTSKRADLDLSKQELDEQKPHYDVASILAQDAVEFAYDQKYTLHADTALYRKMQNHVSARRHAEGALCKCIYDNNQIEAEKMDADLAISELSMVRPQGTLNSLLNHLLPGKALFSSDTLLWNHLNNTLHLKGHVHLQDPSLGEVLSEDEIQIVQTDKQLSSIKTHGKTTVNYLNAHKLTCFGTIDINQKKLQAAILSPVIDGVTPQHLQLSYQEEQVTVFGDVGNIEYTVINNTFQPISISLKGNVYLFSHDAAKSRAYGVTDRLTYSPTTRTFILSADPGKKVIFINEEENLRLSAHEVHITEDPSTKKQSVKGIGSVQLTLSSEEEALMQKILKLSKNIP
ncbi:MAG: hypothetical protein LVR00_09900 [Rhabdochlamydiaceae bacterium]|jgi:hypothetical protein